MMVDGFILGLVIGGAIGFCLHGFIGSYRRMRDVLGTMTRRLDRSQNQVQGE